MTTFGHSGVTDFRLTQPTESHRPQVESLRDKAIKICKVHLMIQYRLNPSEKGYKNMSRLGVPQDAEHQGKNILPGNHLRLYLHYIKYYND
ncbi:hypothetical protein BgiBS90_030953 [Biomphalaria glabrata]|nr:hypothetical protein BgiBS90_030953 [Biomphalaria glabrata]